MVTGQWCRERGSGYCGVGVVSQKFDYGICSLRKIQTLTSQSMSMVSSLL